MLNPPSRNIAPPTWSRYLESTVGNLAINVDDALEIAAQTKADHPTARPTGGYRPGP
jgi:hypothetical protein